MDTRKPQISLFTFITIDMIQQDYFIRIIREFFEALARALEKKEMEGRSKAIQDMYQQYLGSYEYYQNATAEEAIDHIATVYPEEQRYQRMEMLAELYYAEAEWRAYPINTTLLERALQLFEVIDRNSDTFSLARADKIKDIRNRIGQ